VHCIHRGVASAVDYQRRGTGAVSIALAVAVVAWLVYAVAALSWFAGAGLLGVRKWAAAPWVTWRTSVSRNTGRARSPAAEATHRV
jgi:hypothetical protein